MVPGGDHAAVDGVVEPGSTAAKARVEQGVRVCNFKLFAEGLHTLQDSWSHQGKPYLKEGLGHARGARPIYSYEYSCDGEACILVPQEIVGYERLKGWRAAIDPSADYVHLWQADVRRAANATYLQMLKFKEHCPWSCPGPDGTKLPTSSQQAEDEDVVMKFLNGKFPGENVFD